MRRGFTLLEVMVAVTVMGIVAAVTMPVVLSTARTYSDATTARARAEKLGFAMERVVRVLRDVPPDTDPTDLGITSATAAGLTLGDGRGLSYASGVLSETRVVSGVASTSPLVDGLDEFVISYIGSDGTTSVLATPKETHTFRVTIRIGGMELRGVAFARVKGVGS
jgi:prepilin-type N-terminal cleavage/methylation domain-containing protein